MGLQQSGRLLSSVEASAPSQIQCILKGSLFPAQKPRLPLTLEPGGGMGTCTGLGTPAHFMLMTLKATAGICGQSGQGGVGALLVWGDWCLCHALPWAGGNPAGVPAAQAHSVVNNKGRHHQYEKNRILAIYPPTPASLVLSKILLSEKWKGSTPLKKREGGKYSFQYLQKQLRCIIQ